MVSIRILNPPGWAVAAYGNSRGEVFLDVPETFDIRLSKSLDAFSDLQGITQQAALGDALPGTPRNRALLEAYRSDVLDRRTIPLKIEVRKNGERQPITEMLVVGWDGKPPPVGEYEIDIYGDDWQEDLKRQRLQDLDLGTYDWTIAQILQSWSGDRQQLVMPLLADFNGWLGSGEVTRKDLRLAFNLWEIAKRSFCQAGWLLRCDHYERGDGEYAYAHWGGENWYQYTDKRAPGFVHLDIDPPAQMPAFGTLPPFNEVINPGNWNSQFRPLEYLYTTTGESLTLRIELRNFRVSLPASPAGQNPYSFYVLTYRNRGNGDVDFIDFQQFPGSNEIDTVISVNFDVIDELPETGGTSYSFFFGYADLNPGGGQSTYTIESGDVFFRPDPPYYVEDDTITLADTINEDLTGWDLFLALAHLINGKVVTDLAERTVTLYPPDDYTAKRSGDLIEGFYQRDKKPLDLRQFSNENTNAWSADDNERNRFVVVGFADSDDAYVEQRVAEGVYNKTHDRGSGVNEEDEVFNELFVETLTRFVAGESVGGTGILIPAIWEDEELRSVEVSPRVFIYYGTIAQSNPDVSFTWVLEGQQQATVPFFAQVANVQLPAGVDLIPLTFTGFSDDLYQRHYRRELEQIFTGIEESFEITGGDANFDAINFRRAILVRGEDADLLIQAIAALDHTAQSLQAFEVKGQIIKC